MLRRYQKQQAPGSSPHAINPDLPGGASYVTPTSSLPSTGLSSGGGGYAAPTVAYGGYTPDYTALIQNDPGYLQSQAALRAGSISDRASKTAAQQRAIALYGIVPSLGGLDQSVTGDLSDVLDPATKALAQQNTAAGFSTSARLSQAHTDAIRQITNALAARGLLHSGETGYQLGRENQAFGQAGFDATNSLVDVLGGAQSQFAAAENARQQAAANAAATAAALQASLQQNQPVASVTATLGGYGADGSPIYIAPDGTRHNADGSVVGADVPAAPAPAPPPTVTPGTNVPASFRRGITSGIY